MGDIVTWFDPRNKQHIRAWREFKETGVITENFRGLGRPENWEQLIDAKIAEIMSAKTEKHTCEKIVWSGFSSSPHGVGAKYEHEGKWYCKTHHPPNVKSKSDERRRKRRVEREAKDAARANADDIRKAEQRVLAAACDTTLNDAVNALVELGWEPES